jgi:hypothetical protein
MNGFSARLPEKWTARATSSRYRFLLESVAVLRRLETSWVRERISSMQDVANMVIAFGLFDGRGGTFLMVAIRNLYWTERIPAFIVGGLIPAPTIW